MRHQLDRALFEMEREGESWEAEGGMYEALETELAGELLEISSEQELDRFLGKLLSTAVGAGKAFLASDAGKAVGGMLKGAAKQALPQIGRAVGDLISPGAGGDVGGQLGSAAASKLGLELEGLSAEDRELEAAKAFVRFADETARIAEAAPPSVSPTAAAAHAGTVAAQHQLPGIAPLVRQLRPPGNDGGQAHFGPRSAGRWARRGSTIVLFG
jgi:hypothetical protein